MYDSPRCARVSIRASDLAPRKARRYLEYLLLGWNESGLEDLADDARLVVSELVTNAVQHAGTGVLEVEFRCEPGGVLQISVSDHSGVGPALRTASSEDEFGRGLFLVQRVSTGWGVETDHEGGKRVWAHLATDGRRPTSPAPREESTSSRTTPQVLVAI